MKHSFFSQIFCLIYIFTLLFTASCKTPITRQEQIETVRNSVVSFTLRFKTDGKKTQLKNYGTGFFISEKYVATAWHVSRDLENERKEISEKYIEIVIQKKSFFTESEFTIPVNLVADDKENDLAIFSFDPEEIKKQWKDFDIKPLPLEDKLPTIGDDVVSTGFFNQYTYPLSSIGTVAMITEDKFVLDKIAFNQAVFSDLTMLPGNSGGPVYSLQSQEVVGINTRMVTPSNDKVRMAVAVNSIHLRKLLENIISEQATEPHNSL